jgi:hypothetical protein
MRTSDKRQVRMLSIAMVLFLFAMVPCGAAGGAGRGDDADAGTTQHTFIAGVLSTDHSDNVKHPEGMVLLAQRGTENSQLQIVGGPCQYKSYPGRAEIISVRKVEPGPVQGAPPYDPFEVKFSFRSDGKIEEPRAQVEDKEHLLTLTNSFYPGTRFLQKYGITVGQVFDCNLMVIQQGTCTPVIFDFPSIDLSDYFELQDAPKKPTTR